MENRIKELRQQKKLTLQDLANMTGTSNQQISQLETGRRRLNVDWLERLAKALDCHPFDLLYSGAIATSDNETKLLAAYRSMTKEQQDYFLSVVDVLIAMPPTSSATQDNIKKITHDSTS